MNTPIQNNTYLRRHALSALLAAVTLAIVPHSNAAPIATENFSSYTPRPVNITGGTGGTGAWGAGWTTSSGTGFANESRGDGYGAPNLSYPNYIADAGLYLNLAGFNNDFNGIFNEARRAVDLSFGTNGLDIWGSYLYNSPATGAPVAFALVQNGGTVNYINMLNSSNTNNLFVFNLNTVSGVVNYWVDPNLLTWTPATANNGSITVNNIVNDAVTAISFTAPPTQEAQFDQIRLGTTAIDVVPYNVPEPSTIAFLAFGGLAILAYPARSRRRKA